MTYLELVNKVLKRMRETEVTTVSGSAISKVVGELVNDAKRVVEDAWQWSHLIDWVAIETVAGQYNYSLNSATEAVTQVQGDTLGERARFRRNPETDRILSFINFPAGKEGQLREFSFEARFDLRAAEITQDIRNTPDSVGLQPLSPLEEGKINKNLVLWPIPDTDGLIVTTYFTNPQNDLENDGDVMWVPKDPVLQLAYLYSLYERGEELGESASLTTEKARMALSDAIAHDARMQGYKYDFQFDVSAPS